MKSPHSAAIADSADSSPVEPRPPLFITVATDGTEESDGAIEFARELAWRDWGTLRVISACEPVTMISELPTMPSFGDPNLLSRQLVDRKLAVHAQLERAQGPHVASRVTVSPGLVEAEVARFARETRADLIIAGRGRHGLVERLLGEEHLARLIRVAKCPVLAVEPTLKTLPRRIVVGVDFGPGSLSVLKSAISIAADDAAIYLVHVKPDPPFRMPHPGHWLRSYDDGVRRGLELYRNTLSLAPDRVLEPIVLSGHPGIALAEFAKTANADLIAVGARGGGIFSRFVIGSVTTHLLREAPCSLLAVPAT